MVVAEGQTVVHGRGERKAVNAVSCERCRKSRLLPQLLGEAQCRPADCGNPPTQPPWFNLEKYRKAQVLFKRHFLSIIVSNLVGLLCLLTVNTVLKVLMYTGRSSTRTATYKRYLSTINHVIRWYSADVFDKESSAFQSIQLVRRLHLSSITKANKSLNLLTSQRDMVVTQWAFFGLVIIQGPLLGIQLTTEEEECLVHFWKTMGYMLGIEDRFNLATGSIEEVKENCHAVVHHIMIPGLVAPPPNFPPMADAMLDGVHDIVPVVDPSAFMGFMKHIIGIDHDIQKSAWHSRFFFNLMIWNFNTLLHIPVLHTLARAYENFLLNVALFICNSVPIINTYFVWSEKKLCRMWQDMVESLTKVIKGMLLLFNLES